MPDVQYVKGFDQTDSTSKGVTGDFLTWMAEQGWAHPGDELTPDELQSWHTQWVNKNIQLKQTPTTQKDPPTVTGGGGGDPTGGSGGPYSSVGFDFPQFSAPRYSSPSPFAAPAPFSYESFSAPTLDQAKNEPGYQFALQEGQKALQNSAAHSGTLRSGGAEKELAAWSGQFAEQNYGNVFNRASNVYSTNRNNAADNYATNYGVSRDVWNMNTQEGLNAYDRNFNASAAEFNPRFQSAQLKFADLFNRQQLNTNALTTILGYGAQ